MTENKWPRTKNRVTDYELVLISPKTGLLLHIPRTPRLEAGPAAQKEHDDLTKLMQEIVDHMNKTMGLDQ